MTLSLNFMDPMAGQVLQLLGGGRMCAQLYNRMSSTMEILPSIICTYYTILGSTVYCCARACYCTTHT